MTNLVGISRVTELAELIKLQIRTWIDLYDGPRTTNMSRMVMVSRLYHERLLRSFVAVLVNVRMNMVLSLTKQENE